MNNVYHRDLVDILLKHGSQGLRLCRIARKVYNRHVDLFADNINYEAIRQSVGTYLWKQSRKRESPFSRNSYGVYSLKDDMAIQLDLFWDVPSEPFASEEPAAGSQKAHYPTPVQLELF